MLLFPSQRFSFFIVLSLPTPALPRVSSLRRRPPTGPRYPRSGDTGIATGSAYRQCPQHGRSRRCSPQRRQPIAPSTVDAGAVALGGGRDPLRRRPTHKPPAKAAPAPATEQTVLLVAHSLPLRGFLFLFRSVTARAGGVCGRHVARFTS